jgi:hypothetical protein
MPNYCHNHLKLKGSYKDIKDFYENNLIDNNSERRECSKNLTFEYIVPEPTFDNKEDQEYFEKEGWYRWCIENWGTKWNSFTDYVNYLPDEGLLEISFETAWSPPIEWLIQAQFKYPHITFEMDYYEDGLAFKGRAITVDGIIDNQVWEIINEEDYDKDLFNLTKEGN